MAAATDLHLKLLIDADGRVAVTEVGKVGTAVRGLGADAQRAGSGTKSLTDSIIQVGTGTFAISSLAAAFQDVAASADQWKTLAVQIGNANPNLTDTADRLNAVADMAIRTNTSLEGTAGLYVSLERSSDLANKSLAEGAQLSQENLKITEALNNVLRINGTAAGTAAGTLMQLGQAMESGTLRGDELNSVLEGMPALGLAIAQSMGIQRGELKAYAEQGKITADEVRKAVLSMADDWSEAAARMPKTLESAFANLQTRWTQYVGQSEGVSTATNLVVGALGGLADNLDTIAGIGGDALITGLGAAMLYAAGQGVRFAESQVAAAAAAKESAAATLADAEAAARAAAAKTTGAAATLTMARATQQQAQVTLELLVAMGRENPMLAQTTQYQQALSAARAKAIIAARELTIAETGYAASLKATTAAQLAATEAANAGAMTWKSLTSATTLLQGGMAALIGYEVGAWLRDIAEASDIGKAAIGALDTALGALSSAYAGQVAAEQHRAEVGAKTAAVLEQINKTTGLNITSTADFEKAQTSGLVVWNAQAQAWEKGVETLKQTAQGLGNLDTQYAKALASLDAYAKTQDASSKAAAAQANAAIALAKAAGDEAGALRLTAEARVQAEAAAQQHLATERAQLALSEERLAKLAAEPAATANATAARNAQLQVLTAEVEAKRAAVQVSQAAVTQAQAETTAAQIATQTYGDQALQVGALIAQREALKTQLATLTNTSAAGTAAAAALSAAQDHARYVAEAYHQALTGVTQGDLPALSAAYRDAQLRVDEMTAAVAAGTEAEAKSVTVRADLARVTALAADAARDAAQARQAELAEIERGLDLMQREGDLRATHLQNLAAEARARGDLTAALALQSDADEAERRANAAAAEQMRDGAAAASAYAEALLVAAEADGTLTQAERAQVEAARDAAEAKRLAAAAAQESVRHEQALAQATRETAAATRESADEAERDAGARKQGAASEREKQTAANNAPQSTNFEEVYKRFGTDVSRYGQSVYTANNPNYSLQMEQAFRAYLEQNQLLQSNARFSPTETTTESAATVPAATGGTSWGPTRTTRVELVSAGKQTNLDLPEGQDDDLIDALKRAKLASW
jgi:tape measure domain-containing protein